MSKRRQDKKTHSSFLRVITIMGSLTAVIGVIGYALLHSSWIRYFFAHLFGLGIILLLGCLSGTLAVKKGYSLTPAFLISAFLPIAAGILAVLWVHMKGGHGCGGSVSLLLAILVTIIYAVAKPKRP